MKIALMQIQSKAGDIAANLAHHERVSGIAAKQGAELIVFPELSLTNYEPKLAKSLVMTGFETRLKNLKKVSEMHSLSIAIGMPTSRGQDILISMIVLSPGAEPETYSKQFLHADERPYFVEGIEQKFIAREDEKIAPAICYESLQMKHADAAARKGATLYLASVAKSAAGIEKGMKHYPEVAKKHAIPVLMVNGVGPADDFIMAGGSAVWNEAGHLLAQASSDRESILIFDTLSQETSLFHCS